MMHFLHFYHSFLEWHQIQTRYFTNHPFSIILNTGKVLHAQESFVERKLKIYGKRNAGHH